MFDPTYQVLTLILMLLEILKEIISLYKILKEWPLLFFN